mmetsp:Transcript_79720/g.257858  ORF Transcript_79720/g.257858 Transcript_79720/m.257858 type:complete len:827 (-) Transcript_79720:106-2586(-)
MASVAAVASALGAQAAALGAQAAALGAQATALGAPAVAAALGAQSAALGVVLVAPCLCPRSPPAPSTEPESEPTPTKPESKPTLTLALEGECSCRLERWWCHKSCHVSLVGDMLVLGCTHYELEKVTMLPGTQSSADGKALTVSLGKQQLLKLWFDEPHTASMWAMALEKASTCSGKIAEVTFLQIEEAREAVGEKTPTPTVQRPSIEEVKSGSEIKSIWQEGPSVQDTALEKASACSGKIAEVTFFQLEEAREAVGAKSPTTMVQRPSIEEAKGGSEINFSCQERPPVADEQPPHAAVVGRGGQKLSLGEDFPKMRDLIAQEAMALEKVSTCSGKIADMTFLQLEEAREAVGAKSPTTMVQRPSIEEVKIGSEIKFRGKERPPVDDEKPPLAGVVGRGGLKLSLGEAFPNMRDLIAQEAMALEKVSTCSGKIADMTFLQLEEAREAVGEKTPTPMVQRPSFEEVKVGSDIKSICKERPPVADEKPSHDTVVCGGGQKLSLREAFSNMRDFIAQEAASREDVSQFARQERRAPPQSPSSSAPTAPPSPTTAPPQSPCTSAPIVATAPEVPISAALAFAGALASQLAASVPPTTVAQDVPAAVLPGGDFRARISCDEGLAPEAPQRRPDVTWSSLRSRLVQDKADARRAAAATGAPRRPVSLAAVGAPAPLPRPKAWAPALAATGRSAAAAAEAVLPTLPQFDLKPMPSLPPRPEPAIGRIEASRPKAAPTTQAKAASSAVQPKARPGNKMATTASLARLRPSAKNGAPPPRASALGAPAARGSSYGSTPTPPRSAAGGAGAKAKPPTPRTGLGAAGAPGRSRVWSP